jgi:flagellar export protein FliJ
MRPFVFRAQVALDLRQKRDDDARRDLAAANASVARAEAALADARGRVSGAHADARQAQATATDTTAHVWYRNWIVIQQRDVERRHEELELRRDEARMARERATRAHVDLRVLERLKERARRAYDTAVAREEQKAIDWLAVLRSLPQEGRQEGYE